jgi:predicted DNA-binding mobile mystery protein A
MNKKKLIRQQLEATLQSLSPLRNIISPPKGWIRAIRDALGMTAKQLAGRLGVAQQAVARIEKDELTGSVTIKTLRRIAESLDCVFVYGFVPRTTLEATLRKQARRLAARRLARASQTMALENQALSRKEDEKAQAELVDDLVDAQPLDLWNEK